MPYPVYIAYLNCSATKESVKKISYSNFCTQILCIAREGFTIDSCIKTVKNQEIKDILFLPQDKKDCKEAKEATTDQVDKDPINNLAAKLRALLIKSLKKRGLLVTEKSIRCFRVCVNNQGI